MKIWSRVIVARKGKQLFIIEDSSMSFCDIDEELKELVAFAGHLTLEVGHIIRNEGCEDD